MEMGQGVMTSMAQLLAEELEVDWSKVGRNSYQFGITSAAAGSMEGLMTHSSSGVSGFPKTLLRTGGAQIRTMLVRAAASALTVLESELVAEDRRRHPHPDRQSLTYGELASDAQGQLCRCRTRFRERSRTPKTGPADRASVPRVDIPVEGRWHRSIRHRRDVPWHQICGNRDKSRVRGKLKSYDAGRSSLSGILRRSNQSSIPITARKLQAGEP